MANWIDGEVTKIKWWNKKLFSLTLSAPLPNYKAGQFTKLAMTIEDKKIARAYSFVNTPSHSNLHEFLLVTVQDGLLSPPLSELSVGETVHVAEQASGFLPLMKCLHLNTCGYFQPVQQLGLFYLCLATQRSGKNSTK